VCLNFVLFAPIVVVVVVAPIDNQIFNNPVTKPPVALLKKLHTHRFK